MVGKLIRKPLPAADVLDEDDFASDSATKPPSQQSTKAYVDAAIIAAGAGDVIGPASSTDGDIARFDGTTGKKIKGGIALDTDDTLAADSDTRIPSQQAVKAYVDDGLSDKLDSSSYTASDVLTKIKTVDGTGSGLDADTVDGSHASAFAAASHTHTSADITDFAEAVSDQVGSMVTGNTETGISVTYQDADNTLDFAVDTEWVQDLVGAMVGSNTETFITVTYDDTGGKLNFVVPVKDEDDMASDSATSLATQQSIKAYVDSSVSGLQPLDSDLTAIAALTTTAAGRSVLEIADPGVDALIMWDDSASTLKATSISDVASNPSPDSADGILSLKFTDGTLQRTSVSDLIATTGGLPDTGDEGFVVQIAPGVTVARNIGGGSGINVNNNDGISASPSISLNTEYAQDLVGAMFSGNTQTGITVTYQDSDGTIDFVVDSEWVQDLVGAMFSGNTETFITATYQDADGTIDLVVPVLDEDNMASNSASHLATQQSIKAYVDAASAPFASGTGLLFPQTSAPTGWTKQTTHNDKALRIVSGTASSGGTLDFSAVMTTVASDNTTLGGGQNGTHTHDLTYDNASNTSTGGGQTRVTDLRNGGAGAKTATGQSAGASNPHFHNVDLRIKYVDAIIATKD